MKASELSTGIRAFINSGPFEGFYASVIDPTVMPDGHEHQRKVEVSIEGAGSNGSNFDTYILPRQLDMRAPVAPVSTPDADFTVIERGEIKQAVAITDPMDASLDQFRPNERVVDEYISRVLPGGITDVDFMLRMREQRDADGYSPNVAMVGETQSGKTMFVQVLAVLSARADGLPKPYPVFTINGSMGITNYELFGQPSAVIVDGVETIVWMNGLVPLALNCGGILYLDEWNAVPPAQATSIHPVLDDRRQFTNYQRAVPDGHGGYRPEIIKAHPKTWVISTINPGYKGTQTMAEASTNRFRWFEWDYASAVEDKLIPSATVRALGKALREARAKRSLTLPIGTSALRRLNEDCVTFGVEPALWSFTSMFPPSEREKVSVIIEDRGILDLLHAEYPSGVTPSL
jgi:hypothetical protein